MVTLRPHILAWALTLPVLTATAAAQEVDPREPARSGQRPQSAQRIVKAFDFEEQFSNPLDLPAGWIRAQNDPLVPRDRPGFPIYNRPALDYDAPAHSGVGSVRAAIEGGSASLRLKPGVAPIFPLAKYLVRVQVRCDGLTHARPRLVVRALDPQGHPIPESERSVVADAAEEDWFPLAVELPGKFHDAAYLQIDLDVIQPIEFMPERFPGHQIWDQDFDGAVWFDDVIVAQVPQLTLETANPLGIFARPAAPALHAQLRDLAAQNMTATIRVYDSRRRLVDWMEQPINAGRVAWDWQPNLTDLGWYRAVIEITADGSLIATDSRDLLYLDEPLHARRTYSAGPTFQGSDTGAVTPSWRPVGLELTALPPGEPAQLGEAIGDLGVRTATVPLWTRDLTAQGFAEHVDQTRALLAALRESWVDPRLVLPVVPRELAIPLRLTSRDVLDALSADPETRDPFLADALDRLGATTARWQLGPAGNDQPFSRPHLAADLAAVRAQFRDLVPGAELAIGWRADLDPAVASRSGADALRIVLPAWTAQAPMADLLAPWLAEGAPAAEFVLEPATDHLTERDTAADLARRTTELWASASAAAPGRFAVAISDPWRIEPGEEPSVHPTAGAAAWRNLADRLDGRTLAADWPVAPGVRCLVFSSPADDPERGGLIAVWREQTPEGAADFRATLGAEPVTIYDIFGNTRISEPTSADETDRLEHALPLTDEPVFIENINTSLVLFLASVGIDPPLIESATGEHHHAVTLTNPWDVPAVGRVVIASPGGYDTAAESRDRTWDITPRTIPFDLAPGESVRLPLVVAFSRSIEAGVQPFVLDIELTSDDDYGWLRARAQTEVGWDTIELDLTYRLPDRPGDGPIVIEAIVTNVSDIARPLQAIAYAPGQPRARSTIGTLEPGQSVLRRFVFEDAANALAGQRVVVSVSQADGPGRLTKGVTLPGR